MPKTTKKPEEKLKTVTERKEEKRSLIAELDKKLLEGNRALQQYKQEQESKINSYVQELQSVSQMINNAKVELNLLLELEPDGK